MSLACSERARGRTSEPDRQVRGWRNQSRDLKVHYNGQFTLDHPGLARLGTAPAHLFGVKNKVLKLRYSDLGVLFFFSNRKEHFQIIHKSKF